MLNEDDLYKQAVKDVRELAKEVLKECAYFANKYDYEKAWVYDRFREELGKLMRDK